MTDSTGDKRLQHVQFSISSISCVACIPVFRKGLEQFEGISNVKQLPMLNRVVVEFDPLMTNETRVRDKIFDVAEKAGFKGKVIISRQG